MINDGDKVHLYDSFISKIKVIDKNKNVKEYPVIDFESFNKILEENIEHKFVSDNEKERDQDE